MDLIRIPLPSMEGASMSVTGKHGETIVTSASAYDVPRYLELRVDRIGRRLSIKFGYPDSEEAARQRADKDFFVLLGVNSGKLLGFEFENFTGKPGKVEVVLKRAIDQKIQRASRISERLNYQTVKDVVDTRLHKLLSAH